MIGLSPEPFPFFCFSFSRLRGKLQRRVCARVEPKLTKSGVVRVVSCIASVWCCSCRVVYRVVLVVCLCL